MHPEPTEKNTYVWNRSAPTTTPAPTTPQNVGGLAANNHAIQAKPAAPKVPAIATAVPAAGMVTTPETINEVSDKKVAAKFDALED